MSFRPVKCAFLKKSLSSHQINSNIHTKFKLPKRYKNGEGNVWDDYVQLLEKYNAIDLGRGYPNYPPPSETLEVLKSVAMDPTKHQYSRVNGNPSLTTALSKLYSSLIGKSINPFKEILISSGYGGLHSSIFGHVEEGDEVILIEPFFDCYESMTKAAGGKCRYVSMKIPNKKRDPTSADWYFDFDEMRKTFNKRTKMIIINTPNNPLGKVYTKQELQFIADLCKEFNVLCLSDEVYEFIVYPPMKHLRMASLEGMWENTITIGSAGKTFGVTGWKIGWAYGPSHLIKNLIVVHQNVISTTVTPVQEALAMLVEKEMLHVKENHFKENIQVIQKKRDFMFESLRNVGMVPIKPDSGYFVLADFSPLLSKVNLKAEKDKYVDFKFTKWMIKELGILAMPMTMFFSEKMKPSVENYIRICYWKSDDVLRRASELFLKLK